MWSALSWPAILVALHQVGSPVRLPARQVCAYSCGLCQVPCCFILPLHSISLNLAILLFFYMEFSRNLDFHVVHRFPSQSDPRREKEQSRKSFDMHTPGPLESFKSKALLNVLCKVKPKAWGKTWGTILWSQVKEWRRANSSWKDGAESLLEPPANTLSDHSLGRPTSDFWPEALGDDILRWC